jgi:hypothetical protein
MYTHWSDVMGNELNAIEVVNTFNRQRRGESLAQWLEHQSREMWGSDHRDENWAAMAQEIQQEATTDDVRNTLSRP